MTDLEHAIDLGVVLRALRRAADLSQRELAARSGVPQATLARIESGRSAGPSFRTIERLIAGTGGRLTVAPPPTGGTGPPFDGQRPGERPRPVGGPEPAVCAATVVGAVAPGGGSPGVGLPGVGVPGVRLPGVGLPDGGLPVAPQEELRDAAGRHCPAHLDAREVREPKDWPGAWWAHWPSLSAGYWTALPAVTYRLDRELRDRDRIRERVRQGFRVRRHLAPELPTTSWRFVAELPDGELVGELRAHERSKELLVGYLVPDQDQIVLDGILVAPAYRRLGIGRRLVTALTAEMVRCGVRSAHGVADGWATRFLWVCGFRVETVRAVGMRLDVPVSGVRQRRW
ncbi:GNAT family N-acetyltransferase [Micromonospora sp. NPDC051300]|uniref:GNAT family N-acetyltransferase n=1 Tax=Micromonospora sp. NPDC051300 TaxID=3364286 RepID=UPI00379CB185